MDLVRLVRDDALPRLSVEDLYGDLPKLRRTGGSWGAVCPFHEDRNPSFAIFDGQLRWMCRSGCGKGSAVDYLMRRHGLTFKAAALELCRMAGVEPAGGPPGPRPSRDRPLKLPAIVRRPAPVPADSDLEARLTLFRSNLPGSPGQAYLERRGISLELAQRYRLGYCPGWGWEHGRVVVPHLTPAGLLVNLYGRAVEIGEVAPKELRHRHGPGDKGWFNAPAVLTGAGPLFLAEGAFDALSLIAAGHPRAVAVFGLVDWRPEWVQDVERLVIAFDADGRGTRRTLELSHRLLLEGRTVAYLGGEEYGGWKDANEAWIAGALAVGDWPAPQPHRPSPAPVVLEPAQAEDRCRACGSQDWWYSPIGQEACGRCYPTDAARDRYWGS